MSSLRAKLAGYWNHAERFAAKRPWRCALVLTPILFCLLACIFRPIYGSNDDPAMSMIASGKFIALAPDEHLVFTHPIIGLMLKNLYTQFPRMPWYGLYLLTTQALAHTVITGLLLLYCPLRRALHWLAFWFGTIGIYFLTDLQFTTTSFLAGMSGVLLLWEAARRVCARPSVDSEVLGNAAWQPMAWPKTPASTLGLVICGSALLLWCEMIRWYMFYLLAALPLPAIGLWWIIKRPGWKVTAKALAVSVLIISAGLGLKAGHLAYYHADPAWREFFDYNELRAQFNDTVNVVYNEETRSSFEQAGWLQIDMQMIKSWCYDDPTIFSQEKLRHIWNSRTWQTEEKTLPQILSEIVVLPKERPMRLGLFMLLVLLFYTSRERRNLLLNLVVVGCAVGSILLLSFIQKLPPARVYMPIMVWSSVAMAWNYLNRSLTLPNKNVDRSWKQVWMYLTSRRERMLLTQLNWGSALGLATVAVVVHGFFFAMIFSLYQVQVFRRSQQVELVTAIHNFHAQPSKLYVLWGSTIPMENLNPLDSLRKFQDFHMLWLGWPQQMPFHHAMKARYGISNLMREWPEHPEVVVICPAFCTEYYAEFVKAHYSKTVRPVETDTLLGQSLFVFQKNDDSVMAENRAAANADHPLELGQPKEIAADNRPARGASLKK